LADPTFVSYYTVSVSTSRLFDKYVVGWDTTKNPPVAIWQTDVVIDEFPLSGDAHTFTATALEPNTAYYFKLTACNRSGCTSQIIGPLKTLKTFTPDDILLRKIGYRYDPVTGMTRIWWQWGLTPDFTDIMFTGTDEYAGSYTVRVFSRQFTVLYVAPGKYVYRVTNFIGSPDELGWSTPIGWLEAPMTIPSSSRAFLDDILVISDSTSAYSVDFVYFDAGVSWLRSKKDFVTHSYLVTISHDVYDSFTVKGHVNYQWQVIIEKDVYSHFTIDDFVQYHALTNAIFDVRDGWSASSLISYGTTESTIHDIYDIHLRIRDRFETPRFGVSVAFVEPVFIWASGEIKNDTLHGGVEDILTYYEEIGHRGSVFHEMSEPLLLWDIVHQPVAPHITQPDVTLLTDISQEHVFVGDPNETPPREPPSNVMGYEDLTGSIYLF